MTMFKLDRGKAFIAAALPDATTPFASTCRGDRSAYLRLHDCAARGSFEAGFDGRAPVTVACPEPMPVPAPQMALPDDVLQRLGLKKNTS